MFTLKPTNFITFFLKSPVKLLQPGPSYKQMISNRRPDPDKPSTESTDDDSGSLKQPKPKKQMLAKRYIF